MKKIALLTLAIGLTQIAPMPALAQSPDKMDSKMDSKMGDTMDIAGTVKKVDGKITFVADKDGKSWDVMNPETLTAHVGHHVRVNAHVYADQQKIHVMKVTMMKM